MPLPLLPLAIAGGAAYFATKKASPANSPTAQVTVPGTAPSSAQPSQPSQKYPFMAVVPPRVDNQNQPWYHQGPLPQNPVGNVQSIAGIAGSAGSIIHSLSDIWSDMMPNGDTTQDADSNLMDGDEYYDDDEDYEEGSDLEGSEDGTNSYIEEWQDESDSYEPDEADEE